MRLSNAFVTGLSVAALATGSLWLGACASQHSSGSAPSTAQTSAAPAKTAPPKGVAPPADHRMAKVQLNMTPEQVQEIMGSPSGQKNYVTGKSFNPFNYGNDSGSRMEYAYKGEGRVVFALPRWGGAMKVVRVDYDPSEGGN